MKFLISILISIFIALIPAYLVASPIVLNEVLFQTDPGRQWIEIYNSTDDYHNLLDWRIETAGESFVTAYVLPSINIHPKSFVLIAESFVEGADLYTDLSIPKGNESTLGFRLISPQGLYHDTLLYGEPNQYKLPDDLVTPGTSFKEDVPKGYSLARKSDGLDTDNNEKDWFACAMPTPGVANVIPIDLGLTDLAIILEDSWQGFAVTVHNYSQLGLPANTASLRIFLNGNTLEILTLPAIPANSYLNIEHEFNDLSADYHRLEIRLIYPNDPDLTNNVVKTAFLTVESPLVFNEILFKETSDNQEWLEIYNRSNSSIDLSGFYIIDAASTVTNFSGVIPAKSYRVICRDFDKFTDFYPEVSADKLLQATSWAILNNDRETIILKDSFGAKFDSFSYTAPASFPHNLSLERINPYDDLSEWDRSQSPNLSTPGNPNSLLPLKFDLTISEAGYIIIDGYLLHQVLIKNNGYQQINDYTLSCYAYYDEAYTGVLVFEQEFQYHQDNEISFQTEIPEADYTTYRYLAYSSADMNEDNNSDYSFFNNNALPVVVNEIMFRPLHDEPRWVELKVNHLYKHLSSVTLSTERYSVEVPLTDSEYVLLTNSFDDAQLLRERYNINSASILTGLTSIYVAGEEITITDPSDNIIEKLTYDSFWSELRGVSAERVNPLLQSNSDNWAQSIDPMGCTPGRTNSIHTPFIPSESKLAILPNPFSPTKGERTIINISLPEKLSRITCRIFDLKGRLIREIANQELSGARGTLIWDGSGDNGRIMPVGIYIVHVEATGWETERVFNHQKTVVIGR